MPTQYETVEGTNPFIEDPHEARTIVRTNDDGMVYMMTEIEDGVFVQWSSCAGCSKRPDACKCQGGPKMPGYIGKWRDERFEKSLRHAKPSQRKPIVDPDKISEMYGNKPVEPAVDLQPALDAVQEAAKEQGVEPFDVDGPAPFQATDEEKRDIEDIQNHEHDTDDPEDCTICWPDAKPTVPTDLDYYKSGIPTDPDDLAIQAGF